MSTLEFPKHHVRALLDLGTRLLDSRKTGTANDAFARELLLGFHDACLQAGLDRVLSELAEAHPSLDVKERSSLSEYTPLATALVAQLDAANLDGGGPRNAKPKQVAESLVAALGLTLVDEPDRTITLDDTTRKSLAAAMAGVIEVALGVPQLREAIVAKARAKCEDRYLIPFDKIVANLDDHGMRMVKQPKVPIDGNQAVQAALFIGRNAVFAEMSRTAIDRAKDKLAAIDPEAAERIDQPVSLKLTPRDVAILRVCDARVLKATREVVDSLIGSISELSNISWRAAERPVRPYAASQTFTVGELIEHPKFGRGEVTSTMAARIDVEFSDGNHTLVHVPTKK